MGLIKQARRKSRIQSLEIQLKRMQQIAEICGTACQLYAYGPHWRDTDQQRDVKSDQGLVVGVEIIKVWLGQGSGPELAKQALAKAGISELKPEDLKV